MTYLWTLAIRFIVLAHYINPFDIFLEWFYFVIQCYVASCCLWKVHLVHTREIPIIVKFQLHDHVHTMSVLFASYTEHWSWRI